MWFLSFIPDSWIQLAVHALTFFGLSLFVAGSIAYKLPF